MQRVDLKESLQQAANNYAALRELLSNESAVELMIALGSVDLHVFNQVLQTAYGEPGSEERAFFKALTHAPVATTPSLPSSQESVGDLSNEKIVLYALWVMVCPLEDIDYHKLIFVKPFFQTSETFRFKIWLSNVIKYFCPETEWEWLVTEETLLAFINHIMQQRNKLGYDEVYLNLAKANLQLFPMENQNYNGAHLEETQFTRTWITGCMFAKANLKKREFFWLHTRVL